MRSSYIENNYGSVFRSLILASKPKLVVECGLLDGYSTFNIAHALRFNNIKCDFFAYDIFDDYEYNHGDYNKIKKMLEIQKLDKYVNLKKGNAFEVYKDFKDKSINFLHIDISNHGDTLINILKLWGNKISDNGIVAFEGGNIERDEGWIKKYGYKPIRDELFNNSYIYNNWKYQILNPFPGLTLIWKNK